MDLSEDVEDFMENTLQLVYIDEMIFDINNSIKMKYLRHVIRCESYRLLRLFIQGAQRGVWVGRGFLR